jgi:rhodanese-related sulfurtransferase
MASIEEILKTAQERARKMRLSYEGALLPTEAFQVWRGVNGAQLVDVRTKAEFDWIGRIPGAVEIEFSFYPGNVRNPEFLAQIEGMVDKNAPVMFLCRSGGRSHNAAMLATQAGYRECYNVLEGFEGDRDASGHRNTLGGWRAAGLPWVQS